MQLSSTLSWLVDVAGGGAGPDRLLAEVGARLVADGVPLAGGALTLAVPHPLIARRTWLWRGRGGGRVGGRGGRGGGEVWGARGLGGGGWRGGGLGGGRPRDRRGCEPDRRCRPPLARRARG